MNPQNVLLLLKYPLISCEIGPKNKKYTGIITIGDEDQELTIIEKNKPNATNFKLKTLINPEIDRTITSISANNIVEYLDKISDILGAHFKPKSCKNPVSVYRKVINEYSEFVNFQFNLKSREIAPDLAQIRLGFLDEGGREHLVQLAVDFDEANIYSFVSPDLPDVVVKELPERFGGLAEAFGKFQGAVDALQGFFDVVDQLDRCCCVLDPEKASRRDCHRRIWLDQNLSLVLQIDPNKVRSQPDLRFLGPELRILQLTGKINDKLEEWDESGDFVENLLGILELEGFPEKPLNDRNLLMESGECSICFSLRCNDKLPEIICENKSCENFYHVDCLYEWLISVNSKRIFKQVQGQCPNCEKTISCPIPNDSSELV